MSNVGKVAAAAMMSEQKEEEVLKKVADTAATNFEILMVLCPETALNVLQQLNQQITPEYVEEQLQGREAYAEKLAQQLHISEDDL